MSRRAKSWQTENAIMHGLRCIFVECVNTTEDGIPHSRMHSGTSCEEMFSRFICYRYHYLAPQFIHLFFPQDREKNAF